MAFNKNNTAAIYRLALMYQLKLKNVTKAIQYFNLAIDKGNVDAMSSLALLYQTDLKEYDKAAKYFKMAIDTGNVEAMNNLAWLYFITKTNKKEAINLLDKAYQESMKITNAYVCAMVYIWNDQIEEGLTRAKDFMENEDMITRFSMGIEPYLMLLMAKKQYSYLYDLFHENQYNVKDVYKPIYYALMYFMQDLYPDEYKRMGEELRQTVEEIVGQIHQMEIDYL